MFLGFQHYRKIVFEKFKKPVQIAILSCIKAEREGREQNRELL